MQDYLFHRAKMMKQIEERDTEQLNEAPEP